MKSHMKINRLVRLPNEGISESFITPVILNKSEESWSAKIYWGKYNSKKEGDSIEVELVSKIAPKINIGDNIDVMFGTDILASGIIIEG